MARHGWVALQRAARRGRWDRTLWVLMAAPRLGSSPNPSRLVVGGLADRSASTPVRGGARPTVRAAGIGDTGAMTSAGRLQMTGYAALQILMSVPALALFVLNAVAGTLVVIVVGIPVLLLTVPATRWLADRHRRMAAHVLGSPVPSPYRPTGDAGPMERLRIWASDPMTWRDEAWLLLALPLALTLSLLVVLLLVLVVTGVAWWFGVGPIMVARSRLDRALLTFGTTERLEQRVEVLTETRNDSLDHSAAELRRIERDLHDGAQARLVGLGLTLGMAADLMERDPDEARRILDEARHTTGAALGDLRDVVRGIHPPVLADRGLRSARWRRWRSTWRCPSRSPARLTERLPAPVESAVYFAVAECLANVGKHAEAAPRLGGAVARRRPPPGRSSATTVAAAPIRVRARG